MEEEVGGREWATLAKKGCIVHSIPIHELSVLYLIVGS